MKTILIQKLVLFAAIFFAGSLLAFSQISKGKFVLGPDLNFSSQKAEFDGLGLTTRTRELEFGMAGGYFIANNLEIGIGVRVSSKTQDVDDDETNLTGVSIGPHVNYYFPLSEMFQLLISGGFSYNSSKEDYDLNGEYTFTGIGYGLRVGLQYLVSDKLGAFLSVGPDFGKLTEKESEVEIDFNVIKSKIGVNFFF